MAASLGGSQTLLAQALAAAINVYNAAHGGFLTDAQIITALQALFAANL